MYTDELRQRRPYTDEPRAVQELSFKDKVLDRAETVVSTTCQLVGFLAIAGIFICAVGEGLFRLLSTPDLTEVTASYGSINMYSHPFDDENTDVALVVYNASMPSHAQFIRDAMRANQKHKVLLASLECEAMNQHDDAASRSRQACTLDGLHVKPEDHEGLPKEIEIDPEPEIIFYHQKKATDSYRASLRDGSTRPDADRVTELLTFLDVAASRAPSRKKAIDEAEEKRTANWRANYPGHYGYGRHGMRYPGMGGMGGAPRGMGGMGGADGKGMGGADGKGVDGFDPYEYGDHFEAMKKEQAKWDESGGETAVAAAEAAAKDAAAAAGGDAHAGTKAWNYDDEKVAAAEAAAKDALDKAGVRDAAAKIDAAMGRQVPPTGSASTSEEAATPPE